jgi:O-antigen/teichoic acid export membrane protein
MGIVFRQSVKTTMVIFLGALLGAFINYIYAFVLLKQQIGFITNFVYQAGIAQLVVQIGTGSLLVTFAQKYADNPAKRKALITFCATITLAASIIFSIILLLAKDFVLSHYQLQDRPYINRYYNWMLLYIWLWSIMTQLEWYLLSQSKVALGSFMREVVLRLCTIVLVVMVYYKLLSFSEFIIGTVLTHLVPIGIMVWVSASTKGFGLTTKLGVFSKAEYKEFIHFSWYHLLVNVSIYFMGYIDALMLAPLDKSGMESLASYRWAYLIISVMTMPYRAMINASYPVLNQAYIDNNKSKLTDLFTRFGINSLVVAMAMFVLIACNLDNVVRTLPGGQGYEVVKPIVIILMLGKMADMATGMNNEIISISKHYKFNFRLSLILLLMVIIFNRILIPEYSVYGAAWGTTLALIIFNLVKFSFLWKKMDLLPFNNRSWLILVAAAVAMIPGWFLPYLDNTIVDIIVRSACMMSIYIGLLLWLKPSEDLTTYIQSLIKNKRLY